jgi:hypothetical protein
MDSLLASVSRPATSDYYHLTAHLETTYEDMPSLVANDGTRLEYKTYGSDDKHPLILVSY